MSSDNEQLAKNAYWSERNPKCARCGRGFSQTILNLEAVVHHNASEIECVDRKSCKRAAKRKK